jgi:hypothetical protein
MTDFEHSTDTAPAAPRHVRRTASEDGFVGVGAAGVGSLDVGASDGVFPGAGVAAPDVVGPAAVEVLDPAVGGADLDGSLLPSVWGCPELVGRLVAGVLGRAVSVVGEGTGSASTSRPAASITCHVTAAATATVDAHRTAPTKAARPFT